MELDHRTALQHGGARWDRDNLWGLCVRCHLAKTARENERHDPRREAWRKLVATRMESG